MPAPIACNLSAISPAYRLRYKLLAKQVLSAVMGHTELPSGYQYQLNSKLVSLAECAEWISLERLCCPFLTLQLTVTGEQPNWLLTLTGPDGTKPLLDAEFPLP